MTAPFIAATEEVNEIPEGGWTRTVVVAPGVRLFRVSDEFVAHSLLDWSAPAQLKLEKRDDGTYELMCRMIDPQTVTTLKLEEAK